MKAIIIHYRTAEVKPLSYFLTSCWKIKGTYTPRFVLKCKVKKHKRTIFHASMTKDHVGYEIEKHTDSEENIFTILFYAPENNDNKEFGLHLYKDAVTEAGKKSVDFIPNRMIAFAPCEVNKDRTPTWHEVKRLSNKLVGSRNSFQLFFYKNNLD